MRDVLKSAGISAEIVAVKSHPDGLGMLDRGEIAAYFADRGILMYLVANSTAPKRLRIAEQSLSIEPYALAMRRGDEDFRLAVDRALSEIYESDQLAAIFATTFGKTFKMTDTLRMLYQISALPN